MTALLERLAAARVIPVATFDSADQAEGTARALVRAGLACIEVTFRTAAAAEAIRRSRAVGGLLVGAGTVLSPDQAREAAAAGADFALAPGLNEDVVGACEELGLPFFPGVATASEIERARALGLRTLKVSRRPRSADRHSCVRFSAGLGYELEGVDENMLELDPATYDRLLAQVLERSPQLSVVASTLRQVRSASVNDWSAVCHTRSGFHAGPRMEGLQIFDRVGGGDSFASGFFYGLLTGADVDAALAYGVAHGALAMTTPGDTSMATLEEVRRIVAGGSARVIR